MAGYSFNGQDVEQQGLRWGMERRAHAKSSKGERC